MEDWDLLLAKYFFNEASESEKTLVENWMQDNPKEAEKLTEVWGVSKEPRFEPNVAFAWDKVQSNVNNENIADEDLLLAKLFANEANEQEKAQAEGWIQENPKEAEKLQDVWQADKAPRFEPNTDLAWSKVQSSISNTNESKTPKVRTLARRWVAAAAVIISVGIAWWVFSNQADNAWATKMAEIRQTSPMVLADGSKVWLNKHARLRYPKMFDATQRTVYLEGEAFFEVNRNPKKPFVIHSANTSTQVLGTSFNVNANPEKGTVEVSVASGKVALYATAKPDKKLVLTKNEQGTYAKNTQALVKNKTYNKNQLAWKTGVLKFKQTTLAEVAQVFEKYYNKSVRFENDQLKSCVLTTTLDHLSVKDAAEVIALTLKIKHQVSEKEVVFKGTACNR